MGNKPDRAINNNTQSGKLLQEHGREGCHLIGCSFDITVDSLNYKEEKTAKRLALALTDTFGGEGDFF